MLRPSEPDYYGLLLGHVASPAFIDYCVSVSRGTRMPRAEWKDAATYTFSDLAGALPGASIQPSSFVKDIITGPASVTLSRVVLLPADSEFHVLEVALAKPTIGTPQLICKVHLSSDPSKDYYINSVALSVAP